MAGYWTHKTKTSIKYTDDEFNKRFKGVATKMGNDLYNKGNHNQLINALKYESYNDWKITWTGLGTNTNRDILYYAGYELYNYIDKKWLNFKVCRDKWAIQNDYKWIKTDATSEDISITVKNNSEQCKIYYTNGQWHLWYNVDTANQTFKLSGESKTKYNILSAKTPYELIKNAKANITSMLNSQGKSINKSNGTTVITSTTTTTIAPKSSSQQSSTDNNTLATNNSIAQGNGPTQFDTWVNKTSFAKNETDFTVEYDPPIQIANTIVTSLSGNNEETGLPYHSNESTLKEYGIRFPIVFLNSQLVARDQISIFNLKSIDYLPELFICIKDKAGLLTFSENIGMNNTITVIINCVIEGAYRKIALNFYATSVKIFKSYGADGMSKTCYFNGVFKWPSLTSDITCTLTGEKGPDDIKLNTYQTFLSAAKKCGLGFQCTPGCKDINDYNFRNATGQPLFGYKYFPNGIFGGNQIEKTGLLDNALQYGGLDNTSVFDGWVDFYGYLSLVNIPWVFNANITADNLTIKAVIGTSKFIDIGLPAPQFAEAPRILINSGHTNIINNIEYHEESIEYLNSNKSVYYEGALTQVVVYNSYVTPEGEGTIEKQDIQVQENSLSGEHIEEYDFSKTIYLGAEMSPNTPTLVQSEIRKTVMKKICGKQIKIKLVRPNLGLVRGTLVYLSFKTYNFNRKATLFKMFTGEWPTETYDWIFDETIGIPDPSITGTYYISGIEFEYKASEANDEEQIVEYLYLIRKDNHYNNTDKYDAENLLKIQE